jgi:hypothetical protein
LELEIEVETFILGVENLGVEYRADKQSGSLPPQMARGLLLQALGHLLPELP